MAFMNEAKKSINANWFWVFVAAIVFITWYIRQSNEPKFTPRLFENSDTIYTEDSVYKVKFKIDTVWKNNEKHYEPVERN